LISRLTTLTRQGTACDIIVLIDDLSETPNAGLRHRYPDLPSLGSDGAHHRLQVIEKILSHLDV